MQFLIFKISRYRRNSKTSENDQKIPQSQTADKPVHREEGPHKILRDTRKTNKAKQPASSLFPIEMIAKLEWTQSNAQQNKEKIQNTTLGGNNQHRINNNKATPHPERTAAKAIGRLKSPSPAPNFYLFLPLLTRKICQANMDDS